MHKLTKVFTQIFYLLIKQLSASSIISWIHKVTIRRIDLPHLKTLLINPFIASGSNDNMLSASSPHTFQMNKETNPSLLLSTS